MRVHGCRKDLNNEGWSSSLPAAGSDPDKLTMAMRGSWEASAVGSQMEVFEGSSGLPLSLVLDRDGRLGEGAVPVEACSRGRSDGSRERVSVDRCRRD